ALEAEARQQRQVVEGLEQHVAAPHRFEFQLARRDRCEELGPVAFLTGQQRSPELTDRGPVHRLEPGPSITPAVQARGMQAHQISGVWILLCDLPNRSRIELRV